MKLLKMIKLSKKLKENTPSKITVLLSDLGYTWRKDWSWKKNAN